MRRDEPTGPGAGPLPDDTPPEPRARPEPHPSVELVIPAELTREAADRVAEAVRDENPGSRVEITRVPADAWVALTQAPDDAGYQAHGPYDSPEAAAAAHPGAQAVRIAGP